MSRSRYRPQRVLSGSGPRWWRNVHTNRTLRREWQALARAAVTGGELGAIQVTPHNRMRPYYW